MASLKEKIFENHPSKIDGKNARFYYEFQGKRLFYEFFRFNSNTQHLWVFFHSTFEETSIYYSESPTIYRFTALIEKEEITNVFI